MYVKKYPWFLSFALLIFFFSNYFYEHKFFKTKTPNFQLKIKWITFCEFHTKILLIVDGKVPQRGVTIVCFHLGSLDQSYSVNIVTFASRDKNWKFVFYFVQLVF
jgi:hypothetical protein